MSVHILAVADEPFAAIIAGKKSIESRLYDEKRRLITVGDELRFQYDGQEVRATVIQLLRYDSFEEMFSDQDPQDFGGPSAAWLLQQINQFYSVEQQKNYGVVGIRFKLRAAS